MYKECTLYVEQKDFGVSIKYKITIDEDKVKFEVWYKVDGIINIASNVGYDSTFKSRIHV